MPEAEAAAPAKAVDAFIVFNEQESKVETIVQELEHKAISTYFWRRDIAVGEPWTAIENAPLKEARTVVVFLGAAGWGSTHRQLTATAMQLFKRIIPVLIGDPPPESFQEVNELFNQLRYLDMREFSSDAVTRLAEEILKDPTQDPKLFVNGRGSKQGEARKLAQVEKIISVLIDGNEEERAFALRQVQTSPLIDKRLLSARLRDEIQSRFSATAEHEFETASRDPKKISSIRSWMLSCLIWADDAEESRDLILQHLNYDFEKDRNVRFWVLAGLYQKNSSYLKNELELERDEADQVITLRRAIRTPTSEDLLTRFRQRLMISTEFEDAWAVLRTLRIVPIPQLVDAVCAVLLEAPVNSPMAYDSLYALSNPGMAAAAVKLLAENPGLEDLLNRVIAIASASNRTARRSFCVLLAAFDTTKVTDLLKQAERDAETGSTARALRQELAELLKSDRADIFVAGYASDAIDIHNDRLQIQEDVKTLVAVMLAKEVEPPLAVGLFGDWGTGKSFFMQSMKAAAAELAKCSTAPDSKFCSNIVQIEFNAWHYIDANLWASLVSYILERLAAYVSPEIPEEEQQAVLLKELSTAKTIVAEASAEKEHAQKIIDDRQGALQNLQLRREQAEVKLTDLRASELANLLLENQDIKQQLESSLNQIGAPVALDKFSDLSAVVAEAHSLRGRAVALFLGVFTGKNWKIILPLLLVVLVGIPALAFYLHQWITNDLLLSVSAFVTQLTALMAGATVLLRRALNVSKNALTRIEDAKQRVDRLLAQKRQNPSAEEKRLQTEIAGLKAQEQEARARVAAAAARVVELEAQIRAINEGRSLARFLGERVRSEDYRKHLGLISTIRRDFESLATRLTNARTNPEPGFRAADRIILYIDDLDRCPARRVMDVLQAVHLLLAYPLFVVVVGVDPRWLLNSLSSTYGAFNTGVQEEGSDIWRTTPQNYLEKIFQIPFSLRPMTDDGYGRLVSKLLSNSAGLTPTTTAAITKPIPSEPEPTAEISADEVEKTKVDLKPASQNGAHNEAKDEFEIQDDALVINDWETSFAVRLYSFIPSPRATKRFSNIYRILKAHVRPQQLRTFEGAAELPGDFQVPMLLLAMLIGAPDECALLFPKLQKFAAQKKDVLEVFHALKDPEAVKECGLNPAAAAALSAKVEPIISDGGFPNTAEVFLEWLPRVSRFSFEVGRVVQPIVPANV